MASWRDATSPEAQNEMDTILDSALDLATERLTASEDLAPFAVTLTSAGEQQMLGAYPSETAQPSELLDQLFTSLRSDRGEQVVAAVVSDVLVEGQDAVQVHVEHSEPSAPALLMALPYERSATAVTFGSLRAARGQRRIWS